MTGNTILAAAAFCVTASLAQAATIDFSPLTGNNGDAYAGHTQDGFDISPGVGTWVEAQLFGAPVPSIFSTSDTASLEVVGSMGELFTFASVDIGNALGMNGSSVPYTVEGSLGGVSVFSIVNSVFSAPGFETVLSTSSAAIDLLTITLDGTNTSSYNIDNIAVDILPAPVPLPAGALLMLTAVAAFGAARKARKS